ncbi:dTDP-4-dehydrorhamnose reductase [Rhodobacter viridis]|uniref:dTDP-4-dehydrorhamnose reductase n=1 Tax=Rhodobacter viridis TaxID=1054202 RepID=A0A318U0Z3_9RHOB|nr:dTDP-4-dehydrorhamnose reductase [Rhodobacter viridis]PYF11809.1 dTDP-4-dehydrorhamnose reductase [Rhodobacter viridis]
MRVLVFGKTGQVAQELQRLLPAAIFLGREAADLSDPAACAQAIRDSDAEVVINAAAWTAVDKAETEEAAATVVNGEAPAAMARACAEKGLPFLHISTDYVFSGEGTTPWVETDPVAPSNAYGRSKLAGEIGTRAAGGNTAILRTSWVFSAHGANFVKTMLRLSETRDALNVVEDQIGGPTPAADIAAALVVMAQKMVAGQPGGTYHFGGSPSVSWADFAREIFALSGRKVAVTGIPTAAYPTPAVRPLNSRMDCAALARDFGVAAPDWKAGLAKVLKDLEV